MTGLVAWFTGLPSSGKSTLAARVAEELRRRGTQVVVLDSDELRAALVPAPGYDDVGRASFYTTLGRLAASIATQGLVVLVPATAHRRAFRDAARVLAPAFLEIFVDTPLDECRRRDAKGLYADRITQAPGVGVAYEPPVQPDLRIDGSTEDPHVTIAARIEQRVRLPTGAR